MAKTPTKKPAKRPKNRIVHVLHVNAPDKA